MQCPLDPKLFVVVATSGEQQFPGVPACVWIDSDTQSARYTPLTNLPIQQAQFVDGIRKLYDDAGEHYFILIHKEKQHAHVFKYAKSEAPKAMAAIAMSEALRPDTSAD